MANTQLSRATHRILEGDLEAMVLEREQFPADFRSFVPLRTGFLDNDILAQQGFPGSSAQSFRDVGRVSGYLKEFGSAVPSDEMRDGTDLAIATVAHLFDGEASVRRWMYEIFLKQFEENVGQPAGEGLRLESVERLQVKGFADEALAILAVQKGPLGLVSSTVVDFRLGRLLGVAYVATLGHHERLALVAAAGRELERQMVRVALEAR